MYRVKKIKFGRDKRFFERLSFIDRQARKNRRSKVDQRILILLRYYFQFEINNVISKFNDKSCFIEPMFMLRILPS